MHLFNSNYVTESSHAAIIIIYDDRVSLLSFLYFLKHFSWFPL